MKNTEKYYALIEHYKTLRRLKGGVLKSSASITHGRLGAFLAAMSLPTGVCVRANAHMNIKERTNYEQ